MQTSLKIDDGLMAQLEREAARQGRTPSELLELALRLFLASQPTPSSLPPLPTFDGGGQLVNIADRNALYDAMEDDSELNGLYPLKK